MNLFNSHRELLDKAVTALHDRTFFAAFPEHPSPSIYGESADAEGQQKFKAHLGKKFEELLQPGAKTWAGEEESPYLQEPLGILYPAFDVETLIKQSNTAFHQW